MPRQHRQITEALELLNKLKTTPECCAFIKFESLDENIRAQTEQETVPDPIPDDIYGKKLTLEEANIHLKPEGEDPRFDEFNPTLIIWTQKNVLYLVFSIDDYGDFYHWEYTHRNPPL